MRIRIAVLFRERMDSSLVTTPNFVVVEYVSQLSPLKRFSCKLMKLKFE